MSSEDSSMTTMVETTGPAPQQNLTPTPTPTPKRPQYKRVAPIIKNAFRAQAVVESPKKITPAENDDYSDEYEEEIIVKTTATICGGCYNCNWTGYSTDDPEKCKLYM